MPEPDYAKIAYEAWAAHHGWTHLNQVAIVPWDSQPQDIKDAWQAAIDAAFNAREAGADIPKPRAKRGSKAGY